MGLRSDFYFKAAQERIQEACFLHDNGYYALSMYISGLSVECMLRAFRLLKDSTFDERHDLWLLWKSTELANVHSKFYREKIQAMLSVVAKLWNMDELARQRKIWGLLQKSLTEAERSRVIGFITFTPREHKAYTSYREAS
jgi:hypothetical protein